MLDKLSIGSANFQKKYGISNRKLENEELIKIKKILNMHNINSFDTAVDYQNEKNLSQLINNKSTIVTKLPSFNNEINAPFTKNNFEKIFEDHLIKLNIKNVDTVMVHNMMDLKNNYKFFQNYLKDLKKNKITKKIGFSIYTLNDLNFIDKKFTYEVIQIPLNAFDHRFLPHILNNKLKDKEIHIRSIFLQGILIKNISVLSNYFMKWKKNFLSYESFLKKNNYSKLQYLINSILNISDINKIIIGFDNSNQLNQIVDIFKNSNKKISINKELSLDDLDILLPFRWKNENEKKL